MTKTNKIALKIAGGISFFMAFVLLFAGICILFDFFKTNEYINKFIYLLVGDIVNGWNQAYKYMAVAECVFSAAICLYTGLMYFKISKANNIVLGVNKVLLYLGIMQILFSASVVSGIIAICVSISLKNKIDKIVVKPNLNPMEVLTEQVKTLQQLKAEGKVTQEEYDKQLNILLEEIGKHMPAKDKE